MNGDLRNIRPHAVHLVGDPAIQKDFVVVKSATVHPGGGVVSAQTTVTPTPIPETATETMPLTTPLDFNSTMSQVKSLLEPFRESLPIDFRNSLWQNTNSTVSSAGGSPSGPSDKLAGQIAENTSVKPEKETVPDDMAGASEEETQAYLQERVNALLEELV